MFVTWSANALDNLTLKQGSMVSKKKKSLLLMKQDIWFGKKLRKCLEKVTENNLPMADFPPQFTSICYQGSYSLHYCQPVIHLSSFILDHWGIPFFICTPHPGGGSVSTTAQCSKGHGFDYCRVLRFFLCPTVVSYWSIHLSHFVTELRIHHLYSLIITHHDFDSAGPSSFLDACHIWIQLNDVALLEFL